MKDIIVPATFYTIDFGELRVAIAFLSSVRNTYNDVVRLFEMPLQRVPWRSEKHIDLDELFRRCTVLKSEELRLGAVHLSSPGFWEFIGRLNPLNFLVELTKLILEWSERKKKRAQETLKAKIEAVSGYLDLLDRYKERSWHAVPDPDRFLHTKIDRIINTLEREVVEFLLDGKPPDIREESFYRQDRIDSLRYELTEGPNLAKMSALRQLAGLRDQKFLPDIVNAIRESQAHVHWLASDLAAEFGQAAIPLLLKVYEDPHSEWYSKASALKALGKIDSPDTVPYILKGFTAECSNIRMAAAKAAGDRRIKKAILHLERALSDENEYVRGIARKSLEKIGTRDALEVLDRIQNTHS
jgi:hypothetical protein